MSLEQIVAYALDEQLPSVPFVDGQALPGDPPPGTGEDYFLS